MLRIKFGIAKVLFFLFLNLFNRLLTTNVENASTDNKNMLAIKTRQERSTLGINVQVVEKGKNFSESLGMLELQSRHTSPAAP